MQQEAISGGEGKPRVEEEHDGGTEADCTADGVSACECAGGTQDGRKSERFVLDAAEMGD